MMLKLTVAVLMMASRAYSETVVLSKEIMDLTLESAILSSLAYEEEAPSDTETADFETFGYYDDEPDQALTVKKDGYCYVAFRGTSLTWDDWSQNLNIGKSELCVDLGEEEACCTSRAGFFDAYNTTYRMDVENDIRACYETCDNKDECVVLTGHSQGGAIAAVAAIYLADLNPYVFTFGQPATLEIPCVLANTQRWFRWVNTKTTSTGIAYDPIPFAPGLGADYFGHMIVLSDDHSGVAYLGLDVQEFLTPYLNGLEAHYMVNGSTPYPGYEDRIRAVMAYGEYPIRNNGFVAGSLCSKDEECETEVCSQETTFTAARCVGTSCTDNSNCTTDRCDSGVCLPKAGSCESCDEDADCEGADSTCLFPGFKCSGEDGLMDNNCFCRYSSDCESGRCEGLLDPTCEAQLGAGAYCDEHNDCESGRCSWLFKCISVATSSYTRTVETRQVPVESQHAPVQENAPAEHEENHVPAEDVPEDHIPADEHVPAEDVPEDHIPADERHPGEGEEKHSGGVLNHMMYFIIFGVALYFVYKFIRQRRAGYQEVPETLDV